MSLSAQHAVYLRHHLADDYPLRALLLAGFALYAVVCAAFGREEIVVGCTGTRHILVDDAAVIQLEIPWDVYLAGAGQAIAASCAGDGGSFIVSFAHPVDGSEFLRSEKSDA